MASEYKKYTLPQPQQYYGESPFLQLLWNGVRLWVFESPWKEEKKKTMKHASIHIYMRWHACIYCPFISAMHMPLFNAHTNIWNIHFHAYAYIICLNPCMVGFCSVWSLFHFFFGFFWSPGGMWSWWWMIDTQKGEEQRRGARKLIFIVFLFACFFLHKLAL